MAKCYKDLSFFIDWIVCPAMDYSKDCRKIRDGHGEGKRLKCDKISRKNEHGYGNIAESVDHHSQMFNSSASMSLKFV